jgi:hypothetical protein
MVVAINPHIFANMRSAAGRVTSSCTSTPMGPLDSARARRLPE